MGRFVKIEVVTRYDVASLRASPEKVFVFGDNLLRRGTAGQAVIRHEPNAFGIPTKRFPSMKREAFFSDQPGERADVMGALRELYVLGKKRIIVFPSSGLGTGLAQMAQRSPSIYQEMTHVLRIHFGFDQGALQ